MDDQLLIPKKIKVGYQERDDTYTGKLAYVIFYDAKGVLRKQKSWDSWRDHKIEPIEYDNTPTEGFVLNKKVGGVHSGWGWNDRIEKVRVYDPRGFEFEISIPNLLYILRECDCSRGKGLEGKFVYSWDGTSLVLLPASSAEYKKSSEFSDLQDQGVKAKELIAGATYITKDQNSWVFVGRYNKYMIKHDGYKPEPPVALKYVFWNGKTWEFQNDVKKIAKLQNEEVVPNYAELVDSYQKSIYGSKVVEIFLKKSKRRKSKHYWMNAYWFSSELTNGKHIQYSFGQKHNGSKYIRDEQIIVTENKVSMEDGVLTSVSFNKNAYETDAVKRREKQAYSYRSDDQNIAWFQPTGKMLWAKLESGVEYEIGDHELIDPNHQEEEDEDGEE